MEVSMSITRRGKYTNSNICINVQVRNVVCLFFLLYANLLVLVTLCEGNHYPFIEERYNNNFTSLCSTLHFYTISRPNSLIFRQNFFEKKSNGKSWVSIAITSLRYVKTKDKSQLIVINSLLFSIINLLTVNFLIICET